MDTCIYEFMSTSRSHCLLFSLFLIQIWLLPVGESIIDGDSIQYYIYCLQLFCFRVQTKSEMLLLVSNVYLHTFDNNLRILSLLVIV